MSYEEAMQFWFGRVNYEQKTPHIGDFKLERMRQLLALVGNPHRRLRIVHIAGSKGKGSTSALLGSILQHAGYCVGLFTSPHLVAVEERIQVDRAPISREELTALLDEIRSALPPDFARELSFFEIGTALGFLHFVRRRVAFAIIEVGLGGRFDSTNVCDPLVSIITSISFDHMQMLGNTLASIAFEKAGIIKPGRPTISGVREPEAREVLERICWERGSVLCEIDADFRVGHEPAVIGAQGEHGPNVQVTTTRRVWPAMPLGLIGAHQARNAAVAVAAVEELVGQGIPIGDEAVAAGLADVRWPARLEIMSRRPLVLLDCAHNVASARALVQALSESFPLPGRRLLVFGANRDKDLAGMLEVLTPVFAWIYLTSFHGSSRCVPAEELRSFVPVEKRSTCIECSDPAIAWRLARAEATADDLICITGSVFLAGEMRPLIMASNSG